MPSMSVEGDLGLGEVFRDALDQGPAHVDAHLLDTRGIGVVPVDVIGELPDGVGVAAKRMTGLGTTPYQFRFWM
jgi:hypothetical protein